ncbi:MAG: hypothetical protein E7167_03045 [Firmicutes bacterium]|nr:hypothetical protein [Bacillota bacterium]
MTDLADKERYIYNFLNSKSSTLSFYVPRILNASVSQKEIQNYIERVKFLIKEIEQILATMKIKRVPINGFFNELYLLRNLGIKEVNNLLCQFNYKDVIEVEYINVLRKITLKSRLSNYEKLCIEFLILNHLVPDEELVFEYFLKEVLMKESDLNFDTLVALLIDYTKKRMAVYVPNPKCEVICEKEFPKKDDKVFKDTIFLCREDIEELYSSGVFKVIKSMFHSLAHVKQYSDIVLAKKDSPFIIKQIKEEVLSSFCPGYYEGNSQQLSYEVEAEVFSIIELIRLFDRFGINFKNGKNPYIPQLLELSVQADSEYRKIGGNSDTVDNLFNSAVAQESSLINLYPQLGDVYNVNMVDKKVS